MKIASFKAGTTATYGLVTESGVIDAGKRLTAHPTLKALLAKGSLDELKALQGERADYSLAVIELLPTDWTLPATSVPGAGTWCARRSLAGPPAAVSLPSAP